MSWGYDETYTVPNHDVMGGGFFFFAMFNPKKNEGLSPMTLRGVYGPTNHWVLIIDNLRLSVHIWK